jgi:phosphatidylserine decarboxylase
LRLWHAYIHGSERGSAVQRSEGSAIAILEGYRRGIAHIGLRLRRQQETGTAVHAISGSMRARRWPQTARSYLYGFGGPLVVTGLAVGRRGNWWLAAPCFILAGGMAFFFRDPERIEPSDPELILSPTDGRVTAVELLHEGDGGIRIRIFLSLLDVHITRAPVAGRITAIRYRPGRHRNALHPAAAAENERNDVVIEGEGSSVRFAQIAGLIARRIVFWPTEHDRVARGQRVGLIMFGSASEVVISGAATVLVRPGDRVYGGLTALACPLSG